MTSSSLSPTLETPQPVVVGAEVDRLLAVGQDGEMNEDVPEADEGFFVDGELGDEGTEAEVAEPAVSEEKSKEAHEVKFKNSPCRPNTTEVAKHDKTHLPYSSWCPVCVRAKGNEDAHPRARKGKDDATGFPVISMDYELLEEKLTLLVVKDEDSGSTLCYDCLTKGPGDAWVCRQLVRDLEEWGRGDLCLKTDGEASMLALQKALQTMRLLRTVPRNPPAYNPKPTEGQRRRYKT